MAGEGMGRAPTPHWLGDLRPGPAPLCVQTSRVASEGMFERQPIAPPPPPPPSDVFPGAATAGSQPLQAQLQSRPRVQTSA